MKKKIITLVLAVLSALSLAACKTGGNTPAGSTGTVGTKGTDGDVTYDANNILDKFDGKDFGGKDFRIYCANYFNDAVFVRQAPTEDADPADRINAALYKRDSQLEEKYKVKMVYTIATNDQVLSDTAKELASTGEDAMDLLLGSLFYLGSGIGLVTQWCYGSYSQGRNVDPASLELGADGGIVQNLYIRDGINRANSFYQKNGMADTAAYWAENL